MEGQLNTTMSATAQLGRQHKDLTPSAGGFFKTNATSAAFNCVDDLGKSEEEWKGSRRCLLRQKHQGLEILSPRTPIAVVAKYIQRQLVPNI
jgi:hypothetical protein